MPNLPYQTPGWNTHSQVKLREIDYPLAEQEPAHFTVRRTYEGPDSTYAPLALDTPDSEFFGNSIPFTGYIGTDTFDTEGDPHGLVVGTPVIYTASPDGAFSPLVNGALYYAIPVAGQPTQIKLAATPEDAAAGTAIEYTVVGGGGSISLQTSSCYFVRQGPRIHIDGDQIRYDRIFANVPAQWVESESYSYTFPALVVGTVGSAASVTSIVPGALNEVALGTAIAGVSVGDTVTASVKYTRGGVVYNQSFYGAALAVNPGVSVTLAGNLLGSVGSASSVSGTITEVAVGRSERKTVVADSRVVHDYALSSAADVATDLPLFQPFRPTSATGFEAETLNSTTSPTNAQYFDLMNSGGELVAECTRERYMGNIWVRKTRFVVAQ